MTQLPAAISAQSRPDPATIHLASERSSAHPYLDALVTYNGAGCAGTVEERLFPPIPEVTPDVVSSSMLRFLEGVSEDEGGNAARYFPAILLSRMARRVTEDVNSYIALTLSAS